MEREPRTPRPDTPDTTLDPERSRAAQEDYRPAVDPDDERFDYEERVHGNTRRI
jgi:hypothetical protein